jgi:hypothetical protein
MSLSRAVRQLPAARLLLAGEILLLAHQHFTRLEPAERRRIFELVRHTHGRRRNLTEAEREELAELVAKADPRLFLGTVAERLSPMPLPRRVVQGPRKRRPAR